MISIKLIAVDKKDTKSDNTGTRNTVTRNDNTEAYIPKDIELDTLKIGSAYLCYDKEANALKVYGANNGAMNLYALGGVSALGYGVDDGSGGSNYDRLDSWEAYDANKADWVLSAGLGNNLNSRVTSLENGQIEGVATQEWVQQQDFATKSWVSTRGYLTSLAHNHTITIGNASKSVGVGGTANFTLADIGAQAAGNYATSGHTHKVKINGQEKTIAASGGTAVDLGTYLTKHQDISGKADKATTLAGYGITDAKIENGVITLGKNTITPLTSHQSLTAYATIEWVNTNFNKYVLPVAGTAIGGVKSGTDITVDANGNVSVNDNSHNHKWSNISDRPASLPASDVYAWAKASTKPSYTLDEVTDGSSRKLSNYATAADVKTLQGYFTNGVANKANVLNTAHTIWGQSFNGSANVSGNLTFMSGSGGMYGIVPNQSGTWNLSIYTEGQPRLTIKDDGNVGIGTSNPAEKLMVNGNINTSGTVHATVGIYTEGYVSALGQNTSSDIRLKDIQGDVDLPIDMLANAPSKIFEWKGNKALGKQVGTIAQYWQKHLPQVVHENNGYLAMQYDVAALLGVISLAKKVKSHEEKIAELEGEIKELKQELKELKYERN